MIQTVLEDIADEIRRCGLPYDDMSGIIKHLNDVRGENPPGEQRDFSRWHVKTIDIFVCRSIAHARYLDAAA